MWCIIRCGRPDRLTREGGYNVRTLKRVLILSVVIGVINYFSIEEGYQYKKYGNNKTYVVVSKNIKKVTLRSNLGAIVKVRTSNFYNVFH